MDYFKALLGWMAVLPGVVRNCEWFAPVQKRFAPSGRELRLTIDDGPEPLQTPQVLDVLAREGVKADFFVVGKKAASHPDLCRRMHEEGHRVQNHTFTHPSASFWAAGFPRAMREISQCSAVIQEITGLAPQQFRAPVGMANPFVHLAAQRLGLEMCGWSVSAHDGLRHDPSYVVAKIARASTPGDILLLHESHLRGMRRGERACTLQELLATLKRNGFSFTV
jgi:peptidoglycan/xylan/chitin deacetylase (PgdA/CDA1 family)